jgi:predicted DsbA family dithiol-disulfide isomerase
LKIYKFYKNDCPPCYSLGRILNHIHIPENIELIPKNIEIEENKKFAKENGIDKVPALMNEEGLKIIGLKTESEILDFLAIGG